MSNSESFIHLGKGDKNSSKKGVAIPIKMVWVLLAIALILFSALSYSMWLLANSLTKTTVTVLLMVAIFSTPIMIFLGYWFGRTEVCGFLGGVDAALDKIANAVDMRDGSKVNLHQNIQAPPPLSSQSPQENVPCLSFRNSDD